MRSIADQYIEHVINPLERFRKKLIYQYSHIPGANSLLEEVENELYKKYEKLNELIEDND